MYIFLKNYIHTVMLSNWNCTDINNKKFADRFILDQSSFAY